MSTVRTFVASLLSRKLLVAAGSAAALAYEKQWYAAAGVVAAYVASQAHVDAKTVSTVAADVVKDAPIVAAVAESADPALAPIVKTAETVAVDAATAVEDSPAVAAVDAAPSAAVTPAEAVQTAEAAAVAAAPAVAGVTAPEVASTLEADIKAIVAKAKQLGA